MLRCLGKGGSACRQEAITRRQEQTAGAGLIRSRSRRQEQVARKAAKLELRSASFFLLLLLISVPAPDDHVCGTGCVTKAGSGVNTRAAGTHSTGQGAFLTTRSISD